MKKGSRRHYREEVTEGKFSASIHVPTEKYYLFHAELTSLANYLSRRLLPTEPEDVSMREILLNLQNILEYECDQLIEYHVAEHPSAKHSNFLTQIQEGYVAFKTKFEWLHKRRLLTKHEMEVLEEFRRNRNDMTHAKPKPERARLKYFGKPILTTHSLRRMFLESEEVLQAIRARANRKSLWQTTPSGYTEELEWPALHELRGKTV
ncbi:MAG: hypothetical protein R6V03_03940 [Kiritimatiellia bacterium]